VFYAVADEDEPPPENIGIEDRDWYADEECHPMERDWGGPPVTDN
jgi:hypothetical protein